jgi:hypothetical protein
MEMVLVGDTLLWAVYGDRLVVLDVRTDTVVKRIVLYPFIREICSDQNLGDIEVIDDTVVILPACTGVIISTDAGLQWRYVEIDPRMNPIRLSFSSREHGLLLTSTGAIYRTSDGGNTWHATEGTQSILGDLYDIVSISGSRGVAVGSGVGYSQDSGRTWSGVQRLPGFLACTSVVAVDDTLVWAAGSDNIIHSTDGGASWQYQMKDNALLHVIHATNRDTVHAAGEIDHYITSNGGATTSRMFEVFPSDGDSWACSLYPNPVTDRFTVVSDQPIDRCIVMDPVGSVIRDVRATEDGPLKVVVEDDVGTLANGQCMVIVYSRAVTRTMALVVHR